MRLVDSPLHLPGVCICCKGGANRECVDTNQKIGNWRVYVCKTCAYEMAQIFGFVEGDDLDRVLGELASLSDALRDAQVALEAAEASQVRVVAVDDVVPYIKKKEGRPRTDGTDPQEEVRAHA